MFEESFIFLFSQGFLSLFIWVFRGKCLTLQLENINKAVKNMAICEQVDSLKIDENIFELAEDIELEYLVHYAAPYTGGDKCLVPKGTIFVPHSMINT